MKSFISILLLFIAHTALAAPSLEPQYKPIELKEFTSISLDILPGGGTQLIFPFLLDNPELTPSLKIRLTNQDGFDVPVSSADFENLIVGQNTISIIGSSKAGNNDSIFLSNLFISIGGYHISIALRTTHHTKRHISNIVFKLADEERNYLVEQAVKQRTKQLEDNYKKNITTLDNQAAEKSLKHISAMVLEDRDETKFKSEGDIDLGDSSIVVYINKLYSYGDKYQILLFDLENHTNGDFKIDDIALASIGKDLRNNLSGHIECPAILKSDTINKCSFATTDNSIRTAKELNISINSDRGKGEYRW